MLLSEKRKRDSTSGIRGSNSILNFDTEYLGNKRKVKYKQVLRKKIDKGEKSQAARQRVKREANKWVEKWFIQTKGGERKKGKMAGSRWGPGIIGGTSTTSETWEKP